MSDLLNKRHDAAVAVLVALTVALAVVGFAFRVHLAGLILLAAAAFAAVFAWLALGRPVRRSDIRRSAETR